MQLVLKEILHPLLVFFMTKGLLRFISTKSDETVHDYSDNIALYLTGSVA